MNDKKIYPAIVASIVKDVPDYKVESKEASLAMRAIAIVFFFAPDFLHHFTTTISATSYEPEADIERNYWEVISHEGVHARDDKRLGPAFKAAYLFPQGLAPLAGFAVLGVVSHWFLLALLFLVCLAPLPAPGRVWAELRAYLMSGCMDALSGTKIQADAYIDRMTDHFTTGQYYYMSWGRTRMRARIVALMQQAQQLVDGVITLEPYTSTIAVARAADKS